MTLSTNKPPIADSYDTGPNPEGDPLDFFFDSLANRIEGLTGDQKAAYDDLEFYSRYVMGAGDPEFKSNSAFLRSIYENLQYSKSPNFLILGPRGSAKSTAVSVTYVTWLIGRNPLIRILLAVASLDAQGKAFGRQIEQVLSNNERYQSVFGDLVPAPNQREIWTDTEKIVRRQTPPGGRKDPTLGIVGVGANVPSKRADVIIADDIVTQANAYSEVQRNTISTFIWQTLSPILVPGGRTIIIGSRWHANDLYAEAAEKWGLTFPKSIPVIIPEIGA